MQLYYVHVKVRGYNAKTGEKNERTMTMPIRANGIGEAARHPEIDNMLPRLTEGLGRVMTVYRQATLVWTEGA